MSKRFFWLKLKDDFFRSKEIKKLRKIAGGDTYTIIFLKLQLLSIKNEGMIYFDKTESNMSEQIAIEIDEDVENVMITLSFLCGHGLIEMSQNSDILVNSVMPLIGSESDVAERVRKHRDKEKLLQCNTDVTKCNTEKEKEKELEKELILSGEPNSLTKCENKPKKINQELEEKITEALNTFNEITNKKFSPISEKNRKLVKKILTSKLSYHDVQEIGSIPMIKTIVKFKYNQWKNDPLMRNYIQPDTILNFRNFEKYLEEYQNAE